MGSMKRNGLSAIIIKATVSRVPFTRLSTPGNQGLSESFTTVFKDGPVAGTVHLNSLTTPQ